MKFQDYNTGGFFDELFDANGYPRPETEPLFRRFGNLSEGEIEQRQKAAEAALYHMGITFTVYGADEGTERIFPFDIVPRIVSAGDWDIIERGLKQRIHALNLFLDDIYNEQKIIVQGIVPAELIFSGNSFRRQCKGLTPPKGIWCHVTGTDLVRDRDGQFYVLEDNLRCPSGVSYVMQNREVLKRTFPAAFEALKVRTGDRLSQPPVGNSGISCHRMLSTIPWRLS